MNEQTNISTTFCQMLIASTAMPISHAAYCLTAQDLSTEETQRRICQFFSCCWAFSADSFVCERIIVFG